MKSKKLELVLKIASDDASDTYRFELEDTKNELVVGWELEGTSTIGSHSMPRSVLEAADSVFWVDQGAVMSVDVGGKVRSHKMTEAFVRLPAFMLPQSAYKDILAGKPIHVHSLWGDGGPSEKVRTCTASVAVKGKKQKVAALEITAGEVTLKVLKSADWPLVLSREEGDNGMEISSVSMLPQVDDAELSKPAPAKKKQAASDRPASEVDKLIQQLSHKDVMTARKANRTLQEMAGKEDISAAIVDALEREGLLALPPPPEGRLSPAEVKKRTRQDQLLLVLSCGPGERGEALLRNLAAGHADKSFQYSAACRLAIAMRDGIVVKDEPWLRKHAELIRGTDRDTWSTATFAMGALGSKSCFELFSSLLGRDALTTSEGVDRAARVISSLGEPSELDPRWKALLKPLRAHPDLGNRAKETLGEDPNA